MGHRDREIGLRDVRALKVGETIWDTGLSGVAGFGASRQKGTAVSYILVYRTAAGRQRVYTMGRHGSPWIPQQARDKARDFWSRFSAEAIRRQINGHGVTPKRWHNLLMRTSKMRRPGGF